MPNFKYVATHICDSIKRRLKTEGAGNDLQGEFGIGLLSFWTVGEQLTMISTGSGQTPLSNDEQGRVRLRGEPVASPFRGRWHRTPHQSTA